MTITELRDRLNIIIEGGRGDYQAVIRVGRYVKDGRRRSGKRYETASWEIRYASNGTCSFGPGSGYEKTVELYADSLICGWS